MKPVSTAQPAGNPSSVKPAKGALERLTDGVYADQAGGLHIVVPELLEANGYADTPETRTTVVAAAREAFADLAGQPVPVEVLS